MLPEALGWECLTIMTGHEGGGAAHVPAHSPYHLFCSLLFGFMRAEYAMTNHGG